ncbi:hypothetical protein KIPB_014755, partial [Kipferlia bialata]
NLELVLAFVGDRGFDTGPIDVNSIDAEQLFWDLYEFFCLNGLTFRGTRGETAVVNWVRVRVQQYPGFFVQ